MRFSTSSLVILALATTSLVEACPFASSGLAANLENLPKNHPPVASGRKLAGHVSSPESLIGLDGRLVGSPSLDNGAADYPSLLVPIRDDGGTIADVVAEFSTAMGEDFCLIRFQQLPPPEEGDYSFDQNAKDRQSLRDYGAMMVKRFSDLSSPDLHMGGIIHASTTNGYGGIESMCNAGIEAERYCADNMTSILRWPQAVTGYKLNNETVEAVKDAIGTWRSTEEGHLPSMLWSFNGGNPDAGGSEVGYWGNAGGLFSKIVKCSDIPEKLLYYEYPNGVGVADYIDPTTNMSVSDMMYEWWTGYGGYDPATGEQVYNTAFSLPEECRPCIDSIPCFRGQGCNLLDLATGTWPAPYDGCAFAIDCLECHPECTAEKEQECVEQCSEAAPCFDETGCSLLDFGSKTWSTPYDQCNEGAYECLSCYPDCKNPNDGGDDGKNPLCDGCKAAVPCFDETGCGFYSADTKSWSSPFDGCNEALACVDLGCFEGCDGGDGDGGGDDLCGDCAAAAPCFESFGCIAYNADTKSWSAPFDACNEALACVDLGCFEGCDGPGVPDDGSDPTVAPPVAPTTEAPVAAPTDGAQAMSLMLVAMMMMAVFVLW